jgi:hypothetical protein
MTRLTEEKIELYDHEGYDGVFIYFPYTNYDDWTDDSAHDWSEKLKAQILSNQEIVNRLKAEINKKNTQLTKSITPSQQVIFQSRLILLEKILDPKKEEENG